ncbi:2-dehydropantoate 2-reductase [Methylobacterium sp. PvP062]|uniref:2-dehydropantoate 2-reductase n=1 Tax=Methylobacterium radiotolerans TaxID=31998 RepID=A0ABV2ND97_9HYPH|nr:MULTISPECIES: 2-dehydropantoate 2-reductase [Methylobacterium]MCX7334079.1 2-dehydropantoate 2-reductase [Hyphomicrobiales bacterium]KIU37382.1 2-dehydropantoate 2-reductase [Methylobacterium radiotolerans]MBP2492308.1 2-dehydropantoate 2-reductase [Methylobacterium sp. PvP105]MBP2501321.1 2-dehydropantoate 2-reductase [Methylobacterium sp. PvP109]MDE3745479.1 2-dehydropantoate 2-reductase [Methylobacterium radiotolerans]
MRTLIVGAGATGGYYGARLAEAGADVTFLVRPARAAKLAADGLNVRSPLGDLHLPDPPTVTADKLAGAGRFDLILLSCKAYDLDSAVADLAPAVGPDTAILPVLNGMSHLDVLDARFGAERVLGGSCAIAATLAPDGAIRHMSELCSITYGERDGSRSSRIEAVDALMRGLKFQPRLSDVILQEMWEKWVFLATLAGATTLMRAAVGDIVAAPGGTALITALHAECTSVAAASGFEPRAVVAERARAQLTAAGSTFTASMLRDIENRGRIEADHVIGDLIARGERLAPEVPFPLLTAVYTGLKAYEARRAREAA